MVTAMGCPVPCTMYHKPGESLLLDQQKAPALGATETVDATVMPDKGPIGSALGHATLDGERCEDTKSLSVWRKKGKRQT